MLPKSPRLIKAQLSKNTTKISSQRGNGWDEPVSAVGFMLDHYEAAHYYDAR